MNPRGIEVARALDDEKLIRTWFIGDDVELRAGERLLADVNLLLLRQLDSVADARPVALNLKESRSDLLKGIHAGILRRSRFGATPIGCVAASVRVIDMGHADVRRKVQPPDTLLGICVMWIPTEAPWSP